VSSFLTAHYRPTLSAPSRLWNLWAVNSFRPRRNDDSTLIITANDFLARQLKTRKRVFKHVKYAHVGLLSDPGGLVTYRYFAPPFKNHASPLIESLLPSHS